MFNFLAGKIQYGSPLKILSKTLSGETLCKFYKIFPPKVKFFGGKIKNLWKSIIEQSFLKKLAHAYFKRPYFF